MVICNLTANGWAVRVWVMSLQTRVLSDVASHAVGVTGSDFSRNENPSLHNLNHDHYSLLEYVCVMSLQMVAITQFTGFSRKKRKPLYLTLNQFKNPYPFSSLKKEEPEVVVAGRNL